MGATSLHTFLAHLAADQGFYCPGCKSRGLHADDMALSGSPIWGETFQAAVSAIYRAPVCHGCMDEHLTTADGITMRRDCAVRDGISGEYWSDEAALSASLADAAVEAADRRMMAGWR